MIESRQVQGKESSSYVRLAPGQSAPGHSTCVQRRLSSATCVKAKDNQLQTQEQAGARKAGMPAWHKCNVSIGVGVARFQKKLHAQLGQQMKHISFSQWGFRQMPSTCSRYLVSLIPGLCRLHRWPQQCHPRQS